MQRRLDTVAPDTLRAQMLFLYWCTRISIAFLWVWTAIASWYLYPHTESLAWLQHLGFVWHTKFWFIGACALDMVLGVASLAVASRALWWFQLLVVAFYTLALSIGLPEFWHHPFGPISKNLLVLCCLAYLAICECRWSQADA